MLGAVLEIGRVAKKQGRPPTGRDDVSIKCPRKLASEIKAIAQDRDMTVSELMEEICGEQVRILYYEMLERNKPSKPNS